MKFYYLEIHRGDDTKTDAVYNLENIFPLVLIQWLIFKSFHPRTDDGVGVVTNIFYFMSSSSRRNKHYIFFLWLICAKLICEGIIIVSFVPKIPTSFAHGFGW